MDQSDVEASESNDSVDSEDEEEEPKLKYERISGDLQEILMRDGASFIYVNDKLLILGTNWGKIHILDHQGNRIKQLNCHSGPITMIDMDENGDFIASCSHDKKVVVQGLYNTEANQAVTFDLPVRCVAIEPNYGKPRSRRRFIIGTTKVIQYERAMFGAVKPSVLYEGSLTSGEVIRTMKWKGFFVAWAVDSAVRVMDMETNTIISLIKRDHSLSLGCDQYPPHITWQDQFTLLIGWGDSVKVCRVRKRVLTQTSIELHLPPYYVEIVYMFSTDFFICGIGPLDQLVVVLAYNKSFVTSETGDLNRKESTDLEWRRPQMRVLLPLQGSYEELSKDVLGIRFCQDYQPVNYHLENLSEDRRFYIVSPRDVVVAKPREPQDRIQWLLEHDRFQEALEVVENCGGKVAYYTIRSVGETYMDHLIEEKDYKMAASLIPKIAGNDKLLWEKAISRFHTLGHLNELSLLIPTGPTGPPGPLLSMGVYQTVLLDLLKNDYQAFLEIIKCWPKNLYNVSLIINNVLEALARNTSNLVLLRSLAHLYSNIDKHDKALAIYLKLKHTDVFGLIRRHSLYHCISKHIIDLMSLEVDTALQMCLQHINIIEPSEVISSLSKEPFFLYKYLDMLYKSQKDYSVSFHNDLIKLYAIYDRPKLMPLLMSSSHIDLDPALQIVQMHHLVQETVFLLNRMGNSEKALQIVLEEENDFDWAISICQQHSDEDLWKLLVDYSVDKPEYIRLLLNNMGAHVDPLLILQRIPSNLQIPGLRDALTKIMRDYEQMVACQNSYQKALIEDCIKLLEKQVSNQKAAISVRSSSECSVCMQKLTYSKLKGDEELVVFGCRHAYHAKCIAQEQPDYESCVVCTTKTKFIVSS